MLPELVKGSLPRRVVGRPALERRIRLLLIAVHRYGRARARTRDELHWAARTIDGLTALLHGEGGHDG